MEGSLLLLPNKTKQTKQTKLAAWEQGSQDIERHPVINNMCTAQVCAGMYVYIYIYRGFSGSLPITRIYTLRVMPSVSSYSHIKPCALRSSPGDALRTVS